MYVGGANEPRAVGPPSGRVALYPPVWSPDGRLLAFIVNEGDRYSSRDILYTVRVDGSELTRILETTALPTWSQNGEELAFATISTDGEEAVIYMIRPDGTSLRRMWSSGPGASLEPVTHLSWSPDGSELLFVSDGVYVVRSDGSGLRRLAFGNRNTQAVWSPDGSRIAIYYRDELYSSGSLGTMARDGTYPRILATTDADGRFRAWNPPRPETYVDLAACSAGFVVPKPWENSGLVKDCETLLSLRDTLAGRAELPWSTNTFITEWRGVVVAGDPLRVREVVLADMGLTGTIPPEIGDLTELRRLDLSNNWLTSEIPGELGRLVKLEVLDLGFTWLSGHIPPELGRLSCLAALSLKGVRFAGCAPTELPEIWVQQSGLERCEPP